MCFKNQVSSTLLLPIMKLFFFQTHIYLQTRKNKRRLQEVVLTVFLILHSFLYNKMTPKSKIRRKHDRPFMLRYKLKQM